MPVLIAVLAAMALQVAIPKDYTLFPRWPLLVLEGLLLMALLAINPLVMSRRTRVGRCATWVLLSAITVDNTVSAVLLNIGILSGSESHDAAAALLTPFGPGVRVYVTLPDGARAGFTFTPIAIQAGGTTLYRPAWTADAGVTYQLASADSVLTLAGGEVDRGGVVGHDQKEPAPALGKSV